MSVDNRIIKWIAERDPEGGWIAVCKYKKLTSFGDSLEELYSSISDIHDQHFKYERFELIIDGNQ